MSNLIASAGTKEDLEKMINEYYFSTNYIITDNNEVYNTKKECVLDGAKVEFKRNRWKFVRVQTLNDDFKEEMIYENIKRFLVQL